MQNLVAIWVGKKIELLIKLFGLGAGGTWPGEVALNISPAILQSFVAQLKKGVVIVAGTNGKSTTSLMLTQILQSQGETVVHNATGANLLNGVVSAFIQRADILGKIRADWGVFEVDENSLSLVLKELRVKNYELRIVVVLLNLFRDQLDRYGEVDVIADKWEKALGILNQNVTIVLNSDDPQVAHLGKKLEAQVTYFGITDPTHFLKSKEHATDSTFCLNCGNRLSYEGVYYSHLGIWKCSNCKKKRPTPDVSSWKSPLPGFYNQYNTLAAVSVARALNIQEGTIKQALDKFEPAFGRQEEFMLGDKKVKIFLSKNPAGFNASLRTVLELKPKVMLLVLNDRIPDGRDVSWIWDVDFETIPESVKVIVAGDRVYDMALRIKYSQLNQKAKIPASPAGKKMQSFDCAQDKNYNLKFKNFQFIEPNLSKAIQNGLNQIENGDTLNVLPTYSAMLEVRKILVGRKIL